MPADAIIDALFGAGLDRPIEGTARALIAAINEVPAPVYAVDLPSGINGTSGAVMGAAVNATETVTFFRRKVGHLLLPGRLHCGTTRVADIGIPANVLDRIKPQTFVNCATCGPKLSVPRPTAKYSRGHAVVVRRTVIDWRRPAAARGALRAGAGLVTIASPHESPSMRRQALRSWCAPSMARTSWRTSSATSAATWWCWGRAAEWVRRCATWCARRWPASGRWCSTRMR
jgi:hypothetical protein